MAGPGTYSTSWDSSLYEDRRMMVYLFFFFFSISLVPPGALCCFKKAGSKEGKDAGPCDPEITMDSLLHA